MEIVRLADEYKWNQITLSLSLYVRIWQAMYNNECKN